MTDPNAEAAKAYRKLVRHVAEYFEIPTHEAIELVKVMALNVRNA